MRAVQVRGVLDNFVTLTGAAGFTKLLTLATMLFIARVLGPVDLGELAIAQVLIAYGTVLSDAGVTDVTMRDIVAHPRELVASVNITTAVQLAFGALLGVGLVLLGIFAPLPAGSGRLVISYSPALIAFALGFGYALQAMNQMRDLAAMRCLVAITTTVGTVVLVAVTRDPVWVCVMAWFGRFVGDAYAAWKLRRKFSWRPHHVDARDCKAMARRGLPLLGNGILYSFIWVVDTIAIAVFRSPRDLGVYNAAWQVCVAALLAVTTLTDAAYPEMVRRWHVGGRALQEFVGRLVVMTGRVALAGAALVVMESGALVDTVLGQQFAASAAILRIEIWLVPLGFFATILNFALIAGGAQGPLVRRRMVVAVLAVVGCAGAAGRFGIIAVAWVMVALAAIECLFLARLAREHAIASPVADLARQIPYLLVPMVVLAAVNRLQVQPRLAVAIPAWAVALLLLEGFRGFPTPRALQAARRSGGEVVEPRPASSLDDPGR